MFLSLTKALWFHCFFWIKILLTDVILKRMKHMTLFLSLEIMHITWIISDAVSICDFFFLGWICKPHFLSVPDTTWIKCFPTDVLHSEYCKREVTEPLSKWFKFETNDSNVIYILLKTMFSICSANGNQALLTRPVLKILLIHTEKKNKQLLSFRSLCLVTSQHCHTIHTVNTMTIQKLSDYVDFLCELWYDMIFHFGLQSQNVTKSQKHPDSVCVAVCVITENILKLTDSRWSHSILSVMSHHIALNAMITMLVFPVTTVAGISSYEEWLTAWWNAMHIDA